MTYRFRLTTLLATATISLATFADEPLQSTVDDQARALMEKYHIPGMSIAVTREGKMRIFNYGYADVATQQAVTDDTIFELGSISKTIMATITSYAVEKGALSFNDKAEKFMPELNGSTLGETTIGSLATYTAGGLPLQFPDDINDYSAMLNYYQHWEPAFSAGTQRLYANTSIGLAGYLAAISLHQDYTTIAESKIFPALSMSSTYVDVPEHKMADYAFGYNGKGEAVRVNPGMLDAEAYGVKSTTTDLVAFLQASMSMREIEPALQTAMNNTRKGFYDASTFTQGLGWEMYASPFTLAALLEGNSTDTIINPKPVSKSEFSGIVMNDAWVNKTGSTGGFGGYIAFVPAKQIGIVILANKYYPNSERVKAAYAIYNVALQEK